MKVKLSRRPFKRAKQLQELQEKNAGNIMAIFFGFIFAVLVTAIGIGNKL